jgi:type VII secretion integral membrane protein EccD
MSDSLCRLTVAACTDEAHCAVDLALPADMHIGQLLPQIVDLVHRDAGPVTGRDWRLSMLGDRAMDESTTLHDNGVRDGDLLLLTTSEPPVAERVDCDPCHAMAARDPAADGPALRVLPGLCCVALGGFGAAALAWPSTRNSTTSHIVIGALVAVAAGVGAAVVRRLQDDPLMCLPLSLVAVLHAGAVGFPSVPPGSPASGLLLTSAAMFSTAILLLRVTGCGRTCLTAIATVNALLGVIAAAGVSSGLQLNAGGAALVVLSLATLGFAPRLSIMLSGATPDAAPDVGRCHRTLTGLVVGASVAAGTGAAAVAVDEIRDAGPALRATTFSAVVALVLLLRIRTHVEPCRRVGLAIAALGTGIAGFTTAAVGEPAHAPAISVLAAAAGATALGCLLKPTVSPLVLRTTEVVEYLAIAAVVPIACWVGGIYGWAREMNLL